MSGAPFLGNAPCHRDGKAVTLAEVALEEASTCWSSANRRFAIRLYDGLLKKHPDDAMLLS